MTDWAEVLLSRERFDGFLLLRSVQSDNVLFAMFTSGSLVYGAVYELVVLNGMRNEEREEMGKEKNFCDC